MSVFPSLGLCNQVLLFRSSGAMLVVDMSSAMLIGNTGVYAYTLLFAVFVVPLGIWGAMAVALVISVLAVTLPLYGALPRDPENVKEKLDHKVCGLAPAPGARPSSAASVALIPRNSSIVSLGDMEKGLRPMAAQPPPTSIQAVQPTAVMVAAEPPVSVETTVD